MRRFSFTLLVLAALSMATRLAAQCAMCTSTVELQQNGPNVGDAFNRSIGFMLLMITSSFLGCGVVLILKMRRAALAAPAAAAAAAE